MIQYEEGKVLVTAHRGVSGADIPCNTKIAFQIALDQGADILELDVAKSLDGELFVFHPGMEKAHLGIDSYLKDMYAKDIRKLRYLNQDDVVTEYGVVPLDEMFEFLKNKTYINVDKYWMSMEETTHCIRKCGVEDQVIVKIQNSLEQADMMEKIAPDLAVMPVLRGHDNFTDQALEKNIHYVGAEILFETENDPIVSDEYIEKMHKNHLLVYGNSIVYNYKDIISAGHTDDLALSGHPDQGWGWFVKKKFDIIQTDWCLMLKNYLNHMKSKHTALK